jgi:hypothetical protein
MKHPARIDTLRPGPSRPWRHATAWLVALAIAGCGGGGGSSTTDGTAAPGVVLEAVPAVVTDVSATAAGTTIQLSFTVSNPQNVTGFETVCIGQGPSITTHSNFNGSGTAAVIATVDVTGVTDAQSYSCTVSAVNSSGAGIASSSVQATTSSTVAKPTSPGVLSMTGAPRSAVISFSESTTDDGSAVSSYIGICLGNDVDKVSYSYAVASPIVVVGLSEGVPYTCWVSGLNAQGSGKASASHVIHPTEAVAVAADAPAAPTGIAVTRGIGSATVAFTTTTVQASASKRRAQGATAQGVATGSGTLYRATCGRNDGKSTVSVESTASPITVPQLTNGYGYACHVTATTAAGTSGDSEARPVTPGTLPDAPALTGITAGDATATLVFTAPNGDGGSAITGYRASCASDAQVATADVSNAGSVVVAGLSNGSTYRCSVATLNAVGTSPSSNPLDVAPVAPAAPVSGTVASTPTVEPPTTGDGSATFVATTTSTSAVLDYTATCTATSASQQVSATAASSSITVTGLSNGTTYDCVVTARTEAGTSAPSDSQKVTVAATVPAAPTNVSATPDNASITVAFTAGSDGGSAVSAFTATCGDKSGSASASPVTVGGLSNGSIYACTVTATNAVGTSEKSGSANTRPRTVPKAPASVSATAGTSTITVAYTAVSESDNGGAGITGYGASCRSGDKIYAASGASTDTSITVPVLSIPDGSTYDCTVTASNTAGAGAVSDIAKATPAAAVVEAAPEAATNLQMTIGDSQLTVTFDRPASNGDDVSYALICSPGDINKAAVNGSATATGLSNGMSYSCLIRAIRGSKSVDAQVQTPAIPNVKPTRPDLSVTAGDGQLNYSFSRVANSTYSASCHTGELSGSSFSVTGLTNGTSYSCTLTVANSAGSDSASASGTPFTNPDAPGIGITAGTATAGNASLNIVITPPANNGGSAISGYALSCSGNGASMTPTLTGLTATVTGLPNSTAYTCTAKALSQAGGVSVEASVTGTTAAAPVSAPGAPGITVSNSGTSSAGNAILNIALTAPASNGGSAISSYAVSCTVAGSAYTPTVSGLSAQITGLPNGSSYTCSATAKNGANLISAAATATGTTAVSASGAPGITVSNSGTSSTGNAILDIALTAPASNGGSAISSYAVSCAVAGSTYTPTVSSLSAQITGLPNGSSYTCSATAKNGANLTSVATTATGTTAVSASGAPGITVSNSGTSSAGNAILDIALTAPASNGGSAISSYAVSCTVAGSTYTPTVSSLSAQITGLPNGSSFTCSATAKNGANLTSTAATATGTTAVTAPGIPTSVQLTQCGDSSTLQAFNAAPLSNGGSTVTGYVFDLYTVAGQTESKVNTKTSTTPATSTNKLLFAGTKSTTYRIKVYATNGQGTGPGVTSNDISIPAFPGSCAQ